MRLIKRVNFTKVLIVLSCLLISASAVYAADPFTNLLDNVFTTAKGWVGTAGSIYFLAAFVYGIAGMKAEDARQRNVGIAHCVAALLVIAVAFNIDTWINQVKEWSK